ncbi:MAG: protoporphyrinogen oxidase [Deltaproteobacteria bacterium]|nr:protoporphyrinogen oxidase [Deltaproteobacteria bacterium]
MRQGRTPNHREQKVDQRGFRRRRSLDTLVIGAGISGLAYAHGRGADARLLVVEASDSAGGWVHTERGVWDDERSELRYERGPEALQAASPEALALFSGLALELVPAPRSARKRFLLHRGALVALPRSPLSCLSTPLLSWGGKLRLLGEFRRDPRIALGGSLAEFVRHRLGPETVETLLDPFVSGVWAGDPEQLSLRATFPDLARMVEEQGSLTRALLRRKRGGAAPAAPGLCKPRGGMGSLTRALAESLGPRLRLSTPVESLRREGARFHAIAGAESFDCARVVVATSARAAAELLAEASPEASRELATLRCESLAGVIHAWPRERVAHPLDGFGYLVPSREQRLHLGTLFSSSIDPDCAPRGTVLLRTLLGGARHPEVVEMSDRELLAVVEREVGPLLGLRGEPPWTRVLRYRSVLPRYDLAHPARLETVDRALMRSPGLHLLGNYRRGIGVPALIEAGSALAREHARGEAQPPGPEGGLDPAG